MKSARNDDMTLAAAESLVVLTQQTLDDAQARFNVAFDKIRKQATQVPEEDWSYLSAAADFRDEAIKAHAEAERTLAQARAILVDIERAN